ncbi:MAG: flagellar basal body-associated FliL family protein [Alphaproteobacteria bacterium]
MADEDQENENPENENADAVEGAEGQEGEGGDDNKKKMIILAIPVALILIGAGLYFSGMLDSVLGKKAEECVEEVDDHGEVVHACPEEEHGDDGHGKDDSHAKKDDGHGDGYGDGHGGGGAFVEIPTMIVNLNTEGGTPRYLRLSVQLELANSGDNAAVEAIIPRVIDQFQTYLRELRVRDLRGSAGIYRLQTELLWRVNQAAAPIEVKDVLFQEILIQ